MVRSVVACVCLLFSIQTIFASPEIRGWRGVDSETLESLHPRAKIFEHHNELAQIEEEVLQGIKNFDRDWAGRNIFVVRFNYLVLDEETQQYELEKVLDEDGWHHTKIVLQPDSYSSEYENLVIDNEIEDELRVIGEFVAVISY